MARHAPGQTPGLDHTDQPAGAGHGGRLGQLGRLDSAHPNHDQRNSANPTGQRSPNRTRPLPGPGGQLHGLPHHPGRRTFCGRAAHRHALWRRVQQQPHARPGHGLGAMDCARLLASHAPWPLQRRSLAGSSFPLQPHQCHHTPGQRRDLCVAEHSSSGGASPACPHFGLARRHTARAGRVAQPVF